MDDAKVKLIIEAAVSEAVKNIQELAQASEQGFKTTDSAAREAGKSVQESAKQAEKGFQDTDKAARSFGQGLQETWAKMKAQWVEITALIMSLNKAFDMAFDAAKFKTRETAFQNMAASHGASANKILEDLQRISRGTIDTMSLMEKAGTSMMMGISPEKLSELMEIAVATSKMTGQSAQEAFSDISLAVGRESKMILDNLGIIVDVEKANERYAQKLGKTTEALTDTERKQAFLNATLEQGKDLVNRMGQAQDSAAERIQRYQAQWKDVAITIGKVFLNIAQGIEFAFTTVGAGVNTVLSVVYGGLAKLLEWISKIPTAGAHVKQWAESLRAIQENARMAADVGIKHMSETWDSMTAMWEKSNPVVANTNKLLDAQAKSAKQIADEMKKITDTYKDEEEKRKQAIEEIYKETGQNADAYYKEQVNGLVKQATAWKAAGADIQGINDAMYSKIGKLQEEALKKGETGVAGWLNMIKNDTNGMINDLARKEKDIQTRFEQIAKGVQSLDGYKATVHVQLYDQPFVEGVDRLIQKLAQLKSAQAGAAAPAASAQQGGGGNGGTTINNNFTQTISRSDALAIASEMERAAYRDGSDEYSGGWATIPSVTE